MRCYTDKAYNKQVDDFKTFIIDALVRRMAPEYVDEWRSMWSPHSTSVLASLGAGEACTVDLQNEYCALTGRKRIYGIYSAWNDARNELIAEGKVRVWDNCFSIFTLLEG